MVERAGGYLYLYGGCETLAVREGDRVTAGGSLGSLGIDPMAGKPLLYFIVYKNDAAIDPKKAPRG
jgi:septal ring factor EnvC (AmiA/AmiB activator)